MHAFWRITFLISIKPTCNFKSVMYNFQLPSTRCIVFIWKLYCFLFLLHSCSYQSIKTWTTKKSEKMKRQGKSYFDSWKSAFSILFISSTFSSTFILDIVICEKIWQRTEKSSLRAEKQKWNCWKMRKTRWKTIIVSGEKKN